MAQEEQRQINFYWWYKSKKNFGCGFNFVCDNDLMIMSDFLNDKSPNETIEIALSNPLYFKVMRNTL